MNFRATLSIAAATLAAVPVFAKTEITDLRIQNAVRPLAVEDAHPVFSWKMVSDEPGQLQTAYRIKVTREGGALMWDTGKVEDGKSVGIAYNGIALQPTRAYDIALTVYDKDGKELTATSSWEMSLMSPKQSAWKGAQFVGSSARQLDAASHILYGIRTTFRGDKAALVFGADDFRLKDAFLNGYGLAGENYVKVVIDARKPEIRIYRVGYAPGDKADEPIETVNEERYPETNLAKLLHGDENTVEIEANTGALSISINGEPLIITTKEPAGFGPGFFTGGAGMRGRRGPRPASFAVNPLGTGGNYPVFPMLASVGFAAEPGETTEYIDYQILEKGQSEDPVIFPREGGKGYELFEGLAGVTVGGDKITVSNSGGKEIVSYADPTYGGATMVRTQFKAEDKAVKKARLYATAMGSYVFYVNGQQVGNAWFAPGDSQFRETLGYHVYDVTDLLRSGDNALGAELFQGWYTGYMTFTASNYNFFGDREALLARLVITFEDGTTQEIVTDPKTWKSYNDGPIRYGSFFMGERYDATKEANVDGWATADYDDAAWTGATVVDRRDWIDFALMARYDEPVLVRETLTAQKVMGVHDEDTYIYNMGVNMVGVPSVTIPAGWLKKGDKVIMSFGEQLYPGLKGDDKDYVRRFGKNGYNVAGHILYETNRAALDIDTYVADGSGEVTITPRSTFRGYQYVQITVPGHSAPLPLENVKGLVLSSCEIPTGTYAATTTDGTGALLNQLFKNIQRSQLGNFLTIPTDCPQRNERMGWTGDAQAYSRTATYNADVQNFWRQWMVALRDDQGVGSDTEAAGGIGSTVPTYNKIDDPSFADGTTWAAAVCQVPWQMYSQYGDTQVIEENIETMMAWLNGMDFYDFSEEYPHLSSKASGLADWLAMDGRTPSDLPNNAIYIHMMDVTAIMAEAIGREDYAKTLRDRSAAAKEEFNKCYFDSESGRTKNSEGYIVNTQTSYATPLNFGVFNEENAAKATAQLAKLTAKPSESGPAEGEPTAPTRGFMGPGGAASYDFTPYTITTGFSGTPNILPALSKGGYADEAYKLFSSTKFASWLYPVTEGATSMWERWNSYDTAFSEHNQNSMNSFNHFALGSVGSWMFEYQLGITSGEEAGYKDFVLQPEAGGTFTALSGSYSSNYGEIHSSWEADGKGRMTAYECTVPANTTATLYLPVGEDGGPAAHAGADALGIKTRNGLRCAVFRLASGTHRFEW